jgi:hypothetical protein
MAGLGLAAGGAAFAQDAANLAQQTANPVADLAVVPFQFNTDSGFGTEDGDRLSVNIQPVVPLTLNDDWNLITRTIIPIVDQDPFFAGGSSVSGVGDIVQSFFLSPREPGPGGLTWGAGPVFLWPTATEDALGADKFGVGPTAVGLFIQGPWTYGALVNHVWSFAGDGDRDVSSTFLQPFVNYSLPAGTSFFLNTESAYDWEAEQWAVPINFGVNQVVPFGGQVFQIGLGARYWAEAPEFGPEGWGLRVNFNLLFPKG